MKQLLRASIPMAIGMIAAELISAGFIARSNNDYHNTLTVLQTAGYVIVPNGHVLPTLKTVTSAVNGGLFFTLTIGLTLSLISSGLALFHNTSPSTTRLLPIVFSWLLIVGAANYQGITFFLTALLLIVPPIVFRTTLRCVSAPPGPLSSRKLWQHVFLLTAFTATIVFRADMGIFLNIRDRLLLSTAIGEKLNAFYYQNSLYSAQTFKSIGQQLMKPCRFEAPATTNLTDRIRNLLLRWDYLPVEAAADIHIRLTENGLDFRLGEQDILHATVPDFLGHPEVVLDEFVRKSDHNAFFRNFTMFSLLFSGAAVLYTFFCLPLFAAAGRFLPSVPATPLRMVLGIFAALLLVHFLSPDAPIDEKNLSAALSSTNLGERLGALRMIHDRSLDIFRYSPVDKMAESPRAVERYWLARALSKSRNPAGRVMILKLIDDEQFNVVCMAYYALGFQGNRSDIKTVLDRIDSSSNWYEQWYGYRTLRKLGWTQKPSI